MSKIKVAVLFGGASSEYEVSLRSAASVLRGIPSEKYDVVAVGITRDGRWFRYGGSPDRIETNAWLDDELVPCFLSPDRAVHGLVTLQPDGRATAERVEAVFPVLHGRNGEDGAMQGLLQVAGIPFVGCDMLSSAACMDKAVTNTLLDAYGIPHAPWRMLRRHELPEFAARADEWETALGYPMFVKPANAGSSVGITKAHDRAELEAALSLAFEHDDKAVIEKNIVGRELECAVLGNLDAKASVVGEVLSANEFYDYEAKYHNAQSRTVIPADLTEAESDAIRETAVRAFLALGCSGLARVDFLLESATGRLYLNEPNTIPGFTSISMYAKMWEATGLPFPALIDRLFTLALERGC